MKKFSWIFALILALSIGFVGCPSGGDDDDDSGGGGGGNTNTTVKVTGVTVTPTTAILVVGDDPTTSTKQLTESVSPAGASNKAVTWSTNAPDVATVSSTGLVTAVGPGSATITVTTVDQGKTAACFVQVSDPSAPTVNGTVTINGVVSYVGLVGDVLTAAYTGTDTGLTYQWLRNGVEIEGGIDTPITASVAGLYIIEVSKTGYNSIIASAVIDNPAGPGDDGIIAVSFGEGAGQVEIVREMANGSEPGTISYLGDGSGYKFTYGTNGYQEVLLRFPIVLADGVSLSEYSKVTFTWKADGMTVPADQLKPEQAGLNGTFSQDVNSNKKIFLLSSKSELDFVPDPTWTNEQPLYPYITSTDYFVLNPTERIWNGPATSTAADAAGAKGWTPNLNGVQPQDVELPIIDELADLDGVIWVAIYAHVAANGGSYTVSNVKFIPKAVDSTVNDTTPGPDAPVYQKPEAEGIAKTFSLTITADNVVTDGLYNNLGIEGTDNVSGGVDASFPADSNDKRLVFALTPAQQAIIQSRVNSNLKVNLTGTATTAGSSGDSFRYYICDATQGGNWNATGTPDQGTLASINGEKPLTINTEKTNGTPAVYSSRPKHFMIRHSASDAVDINITSITITVYVDDINGSAPANTYLEATGIQKTAVEDPEPYGIYGSGSHAIDHSVIKVSGNGGFWVKLPDGVTASDTVTITYAAILTSGTSFDIITKQVNGWTGTTPETYPSLTADGTVKTIDVVLSTFSSDGLAEGKAYYQTNNGPYEGKLKIISVEKK